MNGPRINTITDLLLRTVDNDGCFEYLGYRNPQGYGRVGFQGKVGYSHRVAWILANGEIPEGLHVLHECDNPPCCNPEHLFLGTNADNVADKISKGRSRHPGKKGELHPNSKLTEGHVKQIYSMAWEKGPFAPSQRQIADQFGITQTTVSEIKLGKIWKHLNLVQNKEKHSTADQTAL